MFDFVVARNVTNCFCVSYCDQFNNMERTSPSDTSSLALARWPLPNFNKSQSLINPKQWLWHIGSSFVVPTVGILSKIMAGWLNKMTVYNREVLIDALDNRSSDTPLLTVSNHHSCLDDPMLWGMLDWRHVLSSRVMRWTAAAHDICFTNDLHSHFFSLGKTFPVVRGDGIYQRAMDFCLERMNSGSWVHFFPEGKVNITTHEFIRLKWGIGRLIAECRVCPIVIPFWHVGMDKVLPNTEPYIPRIGQVVTVLVGNPIDFTELRDKLWNDMKTAGSSPLEVEKLTCLTWRVNWGEMEQRKIITDIVQEELYNLKAQAEMLHSGH